MHAGDMVKETPCMQHGQIKEVLYSSSSSSSSSSLSSIVVCAIPKEKCQPSAQNPV
jgi:hypothetical protein